MTFVKKLVVAVIFCVFCVPNAFALTDSQIKQRLVSQSIKIIRVIVLALITPLVTVVLAVEEVRIAEMVVKRRYAMPAMLLLAWYANIAKIIRRKLSCF